MARITGKRESDSVSFRSFKLSQSTISFKVLCVKDLLAILYYSDLYRVQSEIADELTKEGVYLEEYTASNIPVLFKEVKQKQELILPRQANRLWEQAESCIITKTICKTDNTKLTKCVLSVNRSDSRLMIGLLTGHVI